MDRIVLSPALSLVCDGGLGWLEPKFTGFGVLCYLSLCFPHAMEGVALSVLLYCTFFLVSLLECTQDTMWL